MQKTYWWRIALFLSGFGVSISLWAYNTYLCYAHSNSPYCFSSQINHAVLEPIFFISIALFIVSLVLFFVNDLILKKWFYFAMVWFFLMIILVAIAPEYSGGWGPNAVLTKEKISILLSSLFVILSLVKISWDSWKIKKEVR